MLAALDVGSPHLPEPPERAGGSQADLGFAAFGGPGQRGTEVVALGCRAARASSAAAARVARARPPRRAGDRSRRGGGARPARRRARPAARSAYSRIVSSIPKRGSPAAMGSVRSRLLFSSDSTPATTSSSRSPATAFAPSNVKPPTKAPRLVKSACSSAAQEVVAPLDRGAQRPVPLGQAGAGLGLQDLEPHTETLEDVVRREQLDSGGGELERKREAVQTEAELGDRAGVELGEVEVGPDVACASRRRAVPPLCAGDGRPRERETGREAGARGRGRSALRGRRAARGW